MFVIQINYRHKILYLFYFFWHWYTYHLSKYRNNCYISLYRDFTSHWTLHQTLQHNHIALKQQTCLRVLNTTRFANSISGVCIINQTGIFRGRKVEWFFSATPCLWVSGWSNTSIFCIISTVATVAVTKQYRANNIGASTGGNVRHPPTHLLFRSHEYDSSFCV